MFGVMGNLQGVYLLWAICQPGQLFSDQTAAQGVEFTHHAKSVGDEVFLGAGGAWGDYDNDGWVDLYVADQDGPNKFFKNLGNGSGFVEVGADLGVDAPAAESNGALWGDYDNDGDKDLFVMNRGDSILFRNDGAGGSAGWIFTDVTAELGVAGFGRTSSAVYGDYDNDGWLDLYVGVHYYGTTKPETDDDGVSPYYVDHLYHSVMGSDGQRTFADVAPAIFGQNVLEASLAHSVGFLDYDNDDDLDLYIVNEDFAGAKDVTYCTQMWRNDGSNGVGGWIFTDVTALTHSEICNNPMGLAIGDYNNDGWWDFSMSDLGPSHLYRNNADGTFTETAEAAGVDLWIDDQFGWGILWIDYDLDGWEDFYLNAGTGPGTNQPNPLFRNDGNPPDNTFTDVTFDSGAANDLGPGRAVIKADYDRDGDEDFYIVSYDSDARLCRNDQAGGDYLVLDLVGTVSNRDAIGTRVKVEAAGLADQYRMVQSGSTTNGGNELALYFGVTGADTVDLTIDWPSGLQTVLPDVEVNKRLEVAEEVPPPTRITILGPATIASNAVAVFDVEAESGDGSLVNVTPNSQWSVDPDTYCRFSSPGLLTTFGLAPGQTAPITVKAVYESLEAEFPVEIVDNSVVDIDLPTISITVEGDAASIDTNQDRITLSGTAQDNFGILAVVWENDRGGIGPCIGLESWTTASIPLSEGNNLITVTATDSNGKKSADQVTVVYTLPIVGTPPPPPDDPYTGGNDNDEPPVEAPPDNEPDDSATTNDNDNDNLSDDVVDNTNSVDSSGGHRSASTCGAMGFLSMSGCVLGLSWMCVSRAARSRRRRGRGRS